MFTLEEITDTIMRNQISSSFDQLEFFFKDDFSAYYCYFNNHPSDWSLECFLEYIIIPKEISVEDSDNE